MTPNITLLQLLSMTPNITLLQLLSVTQELEERNSALEQKFTDLVDKNKSLQDREKTLTADLEEATKYGGKDSRTLVNHNILIV